MSRIKTLFLVRHAKSSWDEAGLDDRDRPLNKRGKEDAPKMGKHLAKEGVRPELITSSPAVRALKTARAIAAQLGFRKSDVVVNERLYTFGASDVLEVLRGLDDNLQSVMVVGHNPAMTGLVNELSGAEVDNVPTCGVAELSFKGGSWADIEAGKGELVKLDYPKKLWRENSATKPS